MACSQESLRSVVSTLSSEVQRLRKEVEALRAEPELRLHSRADTAELLGISETKLDDLADQDRIRPVRIGRRVFYAASEIQSFIERHQTE